MAGRACKCALRSFSSACPLPPAPCRGRRLICCSEGKNEVACRALEIWAPKRPGSRMHVRSILSYMEFAVYKNQAELKRWRVWKCVWKILTFADRTLAKCDLTCSSDLLRAGDEGIKCDKNLVPHQEVHIAQGLKDAQKVIYMLLCFLSTHVLDTQ